MPQNRFTKAFRDADAAFNGAYADDLQQLLGLSQSEIDSLTPDTADRATYLKLIKVVETASKDNHSQAQLKENIIKLGELGITIAKKIPTLAAVL